MTWKVIVPELFGVGRIELHTDRKMLIKRMRKIGIEPGKDYLADCSGSCIYEYLESHGILYVYVTEAKVTTLVHELFHASIRYLAYVGVPIKTNKSNETYAYFIEYLTREFLPIIDRKHSHL